METPVKLLRNSERSTYRDCRLKWHWSYNLRLSPEREKSALTFGSLIHKCLEGWYIPGTKRGVHPAKTFESLWAEMEKHFSQWDEDGERFDAYDLGMAMCEGYVDFYGKEPHIKIIQPEMSVQVDVFTPKGKYLVTVVMQCDAAYEDLHTGKKGFLEHKTAKSVPDEVRINSNYGEQGLTYYWGGSLKFHHEGWLAPDEKLEHVLFNFLRKGMPDTRPKNAQGHALNQPSKEALASACKAEGIQHTGTKEKLTERLASFGWSQERIAQLGEPSKIQPKPLFHRYPLEFGPGNLQEINDRIRKEAWEMALVKEGKLPIYKNPSRDCNWKCPFVDACELHEMGGDYESVLELEFVQWDPYEAHELLEEKERG